MDSGTSPARKKLKLVWSYLRGYPVWCTWQVTYRCNFRCSFCPYWKEEIDREESPLEEFEAGAEKLRKLGALMISLAGGEPLLRSDLPQIISILCRYHFPMLTTNGWLVTRQLARELFKTGLWGASVSLDYCDPDRHDAQRGKEGAFQRAVEALKFFSQERVRKYQRVNLMATLNHDNLEEMEKLVQLAAQHDAYFMVQPYSILKTGDPTFLPPPRVSQHLLKLKKRYKNFLSHPLFLRKFDQSFVEGVPGCASGRAFFNIDNFGQVAKCVEFKESPVGNLNDKPVEDLVLLLRREYRQNRCQGCWYNCRGEIESLYTMRGLISRLPTLLFS
ncbi:MAG: radical SAM protein [Candidatus Binatia bacterium]